MTQATQDLEQLKAALDQIGARVASDPAYAEELRNSENQAATLHAAGVSTALLAGVLQEAGAEDAEVAAFGLEMIGAPRTDPDPIIINTICVTPTVGKGSCRRLTLTINISAAGNKPQVP